MVALKVTMKRNNSFGKEGQIKQLKKNKSFQCILYRMYFTAGC